MLSDFDAALVVVSECVAAPSADACLAGADEYPAGAEVTEDVYPPTPQIVEVGTNKSMSSKDFTPPAGDTHKPYQADKRIKFYMDENGKYQKIIANW